jgi:hypothetical protein
MLQELLEDLARSKDSFRSSYAGRLYVGIFAPIVFLVLMSLIFMDSFQHNWKLIRKKIDPNELNVNAGSDIIKDIKITWNPEFCSSITIYENEKVVNDQFKEQGMNVLEVLYRNKVVGSFFYNSNSDVEGHVYLIEVENSSSPLVTLTIDHAAIQNELVIPE